jgi:5-methylcytosine-specific restriction endonuclease McrA
LDCNRHCYNAPRVETGKAVRTVQTVHEAIKPKLRAKILERATGRCELCGKGSELGPLHVGHLISVEQGLAGGSTELELNDPENLAAMCAECNLGLGKQTVPLRMMMSIFMARMRRNS